MKELVFVYGTLKKGCSNHRLLADIESEGLGLVEGWDLYDLGPYPCVCRGEGSVHVEHYLVDDKKLKRLDRLEGYPFLYDRVKVTDTQGIEGWLYFMREVPPNAIKIPDGLWRAKKQ